LLRWGRWRGGLNHHQLTGADHDHDIDDVGAHYYYDIRPGCVAPGMATVGIG
jgi:hypothetical protein